MTLYAEVALPLPLMQNFFYAIPASMQNLVQPGVRVLVPFGERLLTGFIVGIASEKPKEDFKLKEISQVLDESPVFISSFLRFTHRLSEHYASSLGEILQVSLPPSFVPKSKSKISLTEQSKDFLQKGLLSNAEETVIRFLGEKSYSPLFLKKKIPQKNLSSLLARMEKKGLVRITREMRKVSRRQKPLERKRPSQLELDFSLEQELRLAAEKIGRKMEEKQFAPYLLYGSADRREAIYFYLIRLALRRSEQVLFLVPEISHSQSLRDKLEKRLGEKAALLHSEISEKKRELEWQKVKSGASSIIIGSRSALFSPAERLRMIIVDEEQEESYFQEENPAYDARQGARLRAEEENLTLIYGSQFPSVEAFHQAKEENFLIHLGGAVRVPKINIVDNRKEYRILSRPLREGLRDRLGKKEPVYVFLNRRGYASYLLCPRCGHIPGCIRCDLALTYHKKEDELMCHACRYSLPRPRFCPECGSPLIGKKGAGVEAVEEEIKRNFPACRLKVYDRDAVRGRAEEQRIRKDLEKGNLDVLVGTQLLAHETGLPPASLIGILNPEMLLLLADFRSGQKTFQAIRRMMNFLRDEEETEVIIQTAWPQHYGIQNSVRGDYLNFFNQEIRFRRLMKYPPFSQMIEVTLEGKNLRKAAEKMRDFAARVKDCGEDIEILGPALASVPRIKGLNRIQLTLRSGRRESLLKAVRESLKKVRLKASLRALN